jgi:hypothetical protein
VDSKVTLESFEADFDEDLVNVEGMVKEVDGEKVADIDLTVLKTINGVLV